MSKKIIALCLLLLIILSFTGCNLPINTGRLIIENYEREELILNAGDKYTFDMEQFKGYGINYAKYELISSNESVITIKENVITAVDNGFARVNIKLYEKGIDVYGKKCYFVTDVRCANVFVVNEETMTEITTKEQLADIENNLNGNYILKADIDLAGIDWQRIGGQLFEDSFRGMFINPQGFVIKNINASLFRSIYCAYIDGVILDNISITSGGGIAAAAINSFVSNCKVEGEIYAQYIAGGIVGADENGIYRNCEFNGIISVQPDDYPASDISASAGGIIGYYWGYIIIPHYLESGIFIYNSSYFANEAVYDCKVNGEIISLGYAGGIIGYLQGNSTPIDCSFNGALNGEKGQGEMYGYKYLEQFE